MDSKDTKKKTESSENKENDKNNELSPNKFVFSHNFGTAEKIDFSTNDTANATFGAGPCGPFST
jgi:hypothetical protein